MSVINLQHYEAPIRADRSNVGPGLVSCWDFEDLGFIGRDSIGHNHAAVIGEGIRLVSTGSGYAVSFTQQNSYLEIPHSTELSPRGSFSIQVRLWLGPGNVGSIIFSKHTLPFSGDSIEFGVFLTSDNRIVFSIGPNAVANFSYLASQSPLIESVWHDLLFIYNAEIGAIIIDVDGVRTLGYRPIVIMPGTVWPIRIGGSGYMGTHPTAGRRLIGQIENLKYFNYALP